VAPPLAVALARGGKRTVLLAPDIASLPVLAAEEPGLTSVALDAPAGVDGDRLAAAAADAVASHLRADRDFVVMYAESVNDAPLAFALASLADLTLLVAVPGRSRLARLCDAVGELRRTSTRLLGLVVLVDTRRGLRRRRVQRRGTAPSALGIRHAAVRTQTATG
jgi:hypothetical protein